MRIFIISLIECSVTMSALALFFIALTPLLSKKYAAKSLYYCWLVIVIGLIIPFRFHPDTPLVHKDLFTDAAAVQQVVSSDAGTFESDQTRAGTQNAITDNSGTAPTEPGMVFSIVRQIANWPWYLWAGTLWISGALLFIAFHGIRHKRFLKMIRRWGQEINDDRLLRVLQNQKSGLGISKHVGLVNCPCISSPMMIGMIHPAILLPSENYTEYELSLFFRHELVHLKRKDLWFKILVFTATAMHWFNPVIYLMAKAISVQCEVCCDMEVVKSTEIDKRQLYSETILSVAKNNGRMQTAFSTNFYGGKKEMKNRISFIMNGKKKKTGTLILCLALILTLSSGVVFAAGTDNTESTNLYSVEVYNDTTKINLTNKPFIQDGELYLPLRETLNALGIDNIAYDKGNIQINMPMPSLVSDDYYKNYIWSKPADTCALSISSRELLFPTQDRQVYNLRTAPMLYNNTTYVPIDFFEGLMYQGQIPRFDVNVTQSTDPSAYYSAGEEVFIGTAEQQDSYNPVDESGNRKLVKRIITNGNGEVIDVVTVENQKPEVLSKLQETVTQRSVGSGYKSLDRDTEGHLSSIFGTNCYGEHFEISYGIFITKDGETVAYIPPAYQINTPAAKLPPSSNEA